MKKMMEHSPRASAYLNEKFMLIITRHGCRGGGYDYNSPMYFFPSDIEDNERLGQAVFTVIKSSRQVSLEEFSKISPLIAEKQYDDFFFNIMEKFGYKTKKALFMKMKSVSIMKLSQDIEFSPSRHIGLQSWLREKGDGIEDIIVPYSAPFYEIGVALLLAFSRCK